jgi:hypothetical protein
MWDNVSEIKFMIKRTKRTWQNYKTNVNILSEFKINTDVKKTQNSTNKWIHNVRRMDIERLLLLIMEHQPYGKGNQERS